MLGISKQGSMLEYVKLMIPVAIAIGGWIVTVIVSERNRARSNDLERERRELARKEEARTRAINIELDRLDAQIQNLYGPLHASLVEGAAAWKMFGALFPPSNESKAYFDPDAENTPEELDIWRTWIKEVFQPINRSMCDAILKHAHLIRSDERIAEAQKLGQNVDDYFPNAFVQLLAHTKTYDGLIARWDAGDFGRHTTAINFPEEIRAMVLKDYMALVTRRDALLRLRA